MITGRSLKVITVLITVQNVKKNVIIKLSYWEKTLLIADVFIAEVITGRSAKMITVFTTVQKVKKIIVKS